ncbi:response regulator [Aestuariibacter halophilus]|uniref:histidine kinase n=1 Tax=Fluctibacter halophilus TaxID=226011 RepID=A0ABS8GAE7_9ALTE|nr:response regulator [Aestuariibacter halophilus]MCC2617567.1 response regulator [Aestuariibacter halophilus]
MTTWWLRAGAMCLVFIMVMILAGLRYNQSHVSQHNAQMRQELRLVQHTISSYLQQKGSQIRGIAQSDGLKYFSPTDQRSYSAATLAIKHLMRSDSVFFQGRILSLGGQELIRVEHQPPRDLIVLPAASLQNKQQRDYVQMGAALAGGEGSYTQVNLNREYGEITQPYTPTARYVVKLPTTGPALPVPVATATDNHYVLLVFNLNLTQLFGNLLSPLPDARDIELISPDGAWLRHDDPGALYGDELEGRPTLEYSLPELWQGLASAQSLEQYKDWWIAPIYANPDDNQTVSFYAIKKWRTEALLNQQQWTWAVVLLVCMLGSFALFEVMRLRFRAQQSEHDKQVQKEKLQARVEAQQQVLQHIIDNLNLGIAFFNHKRLCVFCNQTLKSIEPQMARDITGQRIEDVLNTANYEQVQSLIDAAYNGQKNSFVRQYTTLNQLTRYYTVRLVPIKTSNAFNVLVSMEDITDIRIAQDDLELQNEQLRLKTQEAKNTSKAKAQFVANISHEIRTPMNGLMGVIQLLRMEELNDEQRKYVDILWDSSNRMIRLLNDILDLSKLDAGSLKLEVSDFNIEQLCKNVVSNYAASAESKGVELLMHIDPRLPVWFRGDSFRLEQVLNNLISNALKFTEQGFVKLSVADLRRDREYRTLCFTVQDTGVGMSSEQVSRIFTEFEQAEHKTAREYGGTGLGLAVSRQIIRMMGGSIEVSSVPGIGSEFQVTVDLPRAQNAFALADWQLNFDRVLVVDDNPESLFIMERYLHNWGLDIEKADNAKVALSLLEKAIAQGRPFDLLVTDYKMPEHDGSWLINAVRQQFSQENLPQILMMTAYHAALMDKSALPLEQVDVISKPISASELYNALKQLESDLPPTSGKAQNTPVSSTLLQDKRILLVEDQAVNRMVAQEILEHAGAIVIAVPSAAQALEAIHRQDIDVVLMDYHMPDMDGIACTKLMRDQGFDQPIIALTAACFEEDIKAFDKAGMNGHVMKPFEAQMLINAITRHITTTQH